MSNLDLVRLLDFIDGHQERPYHSGDWVCSCGSFGPTTHRNHLLEVLSAELAEGGTITLPSDVPIPNRVQLLEIWNATGYAYEAGEYPAGMSDFTKGFIDGDGGLMNALAALSYFIK